MVTGAAGDVPVDPEALARMSHHFEGKAVVVTGAGGSIGSELCHRLVDAGARRLTLVSLTESGLYRIERRLRAFIGSRKTELVPVLGSVCDRGLMMESLAGADVVIHAAAHKHVPICEANPLVAIENNVGGTYTLAQAAIARHVPQFVLISSDKAVHPSSVMGATKRVAEIVLRDRLALQSNGTAFVTVRFGNVLGSDGSVVPLWREQIARGGPLTLTDPNCERFFMSISEAVELILGAASMQPAGGTFIFDMGEPKRLKDLAAEMIRESGQRIEIKFIGLRPGEKLTEELHFGGELVATEHPKIFFVREHSSSLEVGWLLKLLGAVRNRDRDAAVQTLRMIATA
jgi:FlaA1/EpsC-like NDP-sugar epimerase